MFYCAYVNYQIINLIKRELFFIKGDDVKAIQVHFNGFDTKYDEWFDMDSSEFRFRIATLSSMSKPGIFQQL